jgi:acetyl-CoA carboxylase biotin carboxyl carrier protein
MDLKDIQELIKFVAKSGATEVDLEIDNIKISIKSPEKRRRGEIEEITTILQQPNSSVMTAPAELVAAAAIVSIPEIDENANYITIKSSMIGTFYRSSSPETPSFVNVGDAITEGDTLCIIEAMKLFNEIESEVSGKIVKVLVDDTTPI